MADVFVEKGGHPWETSPSGDIPHGGHPRRCPPPEADVRRRHPPPGRRRGRPLRWAPAQAVKNPTASTALRGSCEPPCASSPRRRVSCASRSGHPPRSRRSSSSPSRQASRWRAAAGRSVLPAGWLPGRVRAVACWLGHARARAPCTPSPLAQILTPLFLTLKRSSQTITLTVAGPRDAPARRLPRGRDHR